MAPTGDELLRSKSMDRDSYNSRLGSLDILPVHQDEVSSPPRNDENKLQWTVMGWTGNKGLIIGQMNFYILLYDGWIICQSLVDMVGM